jgi:hypothetical protein
MVPRTLITLVLLIVVSPALGEVQKPGDNGEAAFDHAMSMTALRKKSTDECLMLFEDLANKHSNGPKAAQTRQMIETLKRNLEEEEKHTELWLRSTFNVSKKDRIADLIFRLRYVSSISSGFRGDFNFVHRFSAVEFRNVSKVNAIDRLVAIGVEAMPELLKALDDDTPTSSIESIDMGKVAIPRVGDAVACVINKIAAKPVVKGPFVEDGNVANVREKVMQWWKEYQRKGEKQMLTEGTEAGDANSPFQAIALAKRYPDAALPALRTLLKMLTDSRERYYLVQLTESLKGNDVDSFLLEQLSSSDLYLKISAAEVLWRRRKAPETIPVMINHWEEDLRTQRFFEMKLISFLAETRDADAIRALSAGFKAAHHTMRFKMIECVARAVEEKHLLKPETLAEIEKLLLLGLDELSDEDLDGYAEGGNRGIDWAADGLTRMWDLKPVIDREQPFRVRERQRHLVENERRKRQKRPPLPEVVFPKMTPVLAKMIDPLVEQLLAEKTDEGQQAVIAKIHALGTGCLPSINRALKKMDAQHPKRRFLQEIAGQLSFSISDVRVMDGSVEMPKELTDDLLKLRGKVLAAVEFTKLAEHFREQTPVNLTGRLMIDRSNDGSGAILWVAWRADSFRWHSRLGREFQTVAVRSYPYSFDRYGHWERIKENNGGCSENSQNKELTEIAKLFVLSTDLAIVVVYSSVRRGEE